MVATVANPYAPAPPQANIRAADAAFPPDEFHTIANVPVFAEHETTARDGRRLRFGPAELQAVCDRCNQRIRDTGDYAALVLGHTSAPDDPHQKEPELVGFAGPFKLGTLGQSGGKQRTAILADFHFFRSDLEKAKKYPRRSPELWLEDRYEEMFLDPIALLGAEAPRLDMGLLYSAMYHGRLRERYTAVAPAAGNVAIRDDDFQREPYQQEEPSAMLGPDDIRQIVQALESLDWVQGVKQLLAEQSGNNATVGGEMGPPAGPAAPPMPPAPMPPAPPNAAPPGAPPTAEPPAGPPAGPTPPASGDMDAPAPGGEPSPPPAAPPESPSAPSGGPPEAPDADADKERLCKYAALDEMDLDDEEIEEYVRGRKRRKGHRKHYEAGGDDIDPSDEGNPTTADVEGSPGPHGDGSNDDEDDAAGEYQTASPPQKYQRNGEVLALRRELDALKQRLERTHTQVQQERAARVDAERYSLLSERRQMYAFDLDKEIARCRYARMNDEQFSEHLQAIEENYRQIPLDASLPTFTRQAQQAADSAPNRPGAGAERERYSKEQSDTARAWCERRAIAGKDYDYGAALEALRTGKSLPE